LPLRFPIRPEGLTSGPTLRPSGGPNGAPTYEMWKRRIGASLARRDEWKESVIRFFVELRGERVITWGAEEMQQYFDFWVNILYSNAKILLGHIYFQDPKLIVKKTTDRVIELAPMIEALAQYYQRELKIKRTNQKALINGIITNLGVTKTGYKAIFGEPIEAVDERDEDSIAVTERSLRQMGLLKDEKKGVLDPEKYHELIADERPFVINVSPFDMLFPVGSKEMDELQWVGQEITTFLSTVKNNPLYPKELTENLQGTHIVEMPEGRRMLGIDRDAFAGDEEYKIIRIYEIYDMKNNQFHIIEPTVRDFLHSSANPYEVLDGHPYDFFQPCISPGKDVYGTPLPKIDEAVRLEYVTIRQRIMAHIDKFVARLAVRSDGLDEATLRQAKQGDLGSIIITTDDPNKVFSGMPNPGIDPATFIHLNQLLNDLRISTGISEAKRSGEGRRKTKGEAVLIEKGSDVALSVDQDKVDDFVTGQARRLVQVILRFVDYPIALMFADPGQAEQERAVIPSEDIRAEVHFSVKVGSSQQPNPELDRILKTDLFSLAINPATREALGFQGKAPDYVRMFEDVVAAHNLPNPEDYLVDLPPPEQELEEGEEGGQEPANILQALAGGQQ